MIYSLIPAMIEKFSEEVQASKDLYNKNLVKCYKANFNGFREEIRAREM
jgi:hypothetical protein